MKPDRMILYCTACSLCSGLAGRKNCCLSRPAHRPTLSKLPLTWISYHLCMAVTQLKARLTADFVWTEASV